MSARMYCEQCQTEHEPYYECDPRDVELAGLRAERAAAWAKREEEASAETSVRSEP